MIHNMRECYREALVFRIPLCFHAIGLLSLPYFGSCLRRPIMTKSRLLEPRKYSSIDSLLKELLRLKDQSFMNLYRIKSIFGDIVIL